MKKLKKYNKLKEEEIKIIAQKPIEEKIKLFEELQEFIYKFYKAGRDYVKRNRNKSK